LSNSIVVPNSEEHVFTTATDQAVARTTFRIIEQQFRHLATSAELRSPNVQAELVTAVEQAMTPTIQQGTLDGVLETANVRKVVAKLADLIVERSIDVPRIIILPKGEITSGFHDFDLEIGSNLCPQPVAQDILIQHLRDYKRDRLKGGTPNKEPVPENYLVRRLIDYDDISYENHADLLYKLSGQIVEHLRSYLSDKEEIHNVLQYHDELLARLIYNQMQQHYWETATEYEARVSAGFISLQVNSYDAYAEQPLVNYRDTIADLQSIRTTLFSGFLRCLYPIQKFHSDSERRFAILLEDDQTVRKWFKPARNQLKIYYRSDSTYEPDFVVETETQKHLCEPKRASEMESEEVKAKSKAAATWCRYATDHARSHGDKPWSYLLIPHDAITANMTLHGLTARFTLNGNGVAH